MLAKASTVLSACWLLQLYSGTCSAGSIYDNDVFVQEEGEHQDIHLMQVGAHVIESDHREQEHPMQRNSTTGGSMEVTPSAQLVALKSRLTAMQHELDKEHSLHQQLLAQKELLLSPPTRSGSSYVAGGHILRDNSSDNSSLASKSGQDPPGTTPSYSSVSQAPVYSSRPAPTSTYAYYPATTTSMAKAPEPLPPGFPDNRMDMWPKPPFEDEIPDPKPRSISPEKKDEWWTNPELPKEVRKEIAENRWEEHFAEIADEKKEAKIVSCTICAMIIVFVLSHVMHDLDIHILPEAVMVIFVGVLLGYLLKYWCMSRIMFDSEYRSEIAIQLLNEIFLPMLMLEAGWSVRRLDFISQLPYILNFAIFGTLISTGVIGYLLYKTGQAGYHPVTTARGSMVVAALISATDPVATLGTYSELKVDPLLNIVVFGEAAINDAVAIVVFTLVNDSFLLAQYEGPNLIYFGIYSGIKTLMCSFMVGCFTSTIVCMILKAASMRRNKKLEILCVVLGGYLSYAFGEWAQVSGIISTLFNGMFMGKYAKYHLSKDGSLLTSFYISQMSTIMDAGVFMLSGVCCVCLNFEDESLGGLLIIFCAVARVCSTVPCGLLSNFMKRVLKRNPQIADSDIHLLTPKYLFMMWHAGLRGGIAENLALQIGPWLDETCGVGTKNAVRSSVFFLVAVYVVVFGGTTKLFLGWLGIPMGCENPQDVLSRTELVHSEAKAIDWLHEKVFFPLLVGKAASEQNQDVDESIDDEDVIGILHEVCHGHRGGLLRKKEKSDMSK